MTELIIDEADVHALKALAAGTASAGQQQRALRFVFNASGIREQPRVTENPLELAFREGKRYVGWQIARIVELTGVTADLNQPKDTQ